MDKNEHDKIMAFDTLFTTNHIQMMKIVMPYLDKQMQKNIAVYIKYMEFQYTLSYFRSYSFELCGCSIEKEDFDISKICSEILPYCTNEEKQKVEQISGLLRSMEMYKEMSKTFEMMKDMFPEGFGDSFPFGAQPDGTNDFMGSFMNSNAGEGNASSNGMMDMLMNMLTPEQKTMFEMFGGNNSDDTK